MELAQDLDDPRRAVRPALSFTCVHVVSGFAAGPVYARVYRRGSVVSRPSLGAPVPDEPRNNLFRRQTWRVSSVAFPGPILGLKPFHHDLDAGRA